MRVVIVGGGIGGVVTALELGAVGVESVVVEQARAIRPVGAGIQIAPNASRQLVRLGLGDALAAVAVEPEAILVRSHKRGRVLQRTPLGAEARRRFGFPYYHVHRADLMDILVGALPAGVLRLGRQVTGIEDTGQGVRVELAGGEVLAADVVVGADGIHSTVRARLHGPDRPRFSGMICWRGVVPAERLVGVELPRVCEAYYGPGRSVVSYWVSSGRAYNFVGIVPAGEAWSDEDWTAQGSRDDLQADIATFHEPVRAVAACIEHPLRWGIFDRDPLPWWSRGRVTLLGDAAHPMLPYLAQGACHAVEDAGVMARCLVRWKDDPVAALAAYDEVRRPRATQTQLLARSQERVFHLDDWRSVWRRNQAMRAAARRDPGTATAVPTAATMYDYDAATVPLPARAGTS